MDNEKKNIWQKLLEIQKEFKTFAVTEDSAKVNSKGKSEYKYTPGWQIVEKIREKMDSLGLMLLPQITAQDIRMIEHPVYKILSGSITSFIKKEMFITVNVNYTWKDAETGEETGPFSIVASGANGTDKSCATALSYAEKYFLLKFFHITTRETDDEPDAHDSGDIPGIPAEQQPLPGQPYQPYAAAPAGCPLGTAPAAGPASAPAQQAVAPQPQFNPADQNIIEAADKLSHFVFGTPGYQSAMNDVITLLSSKGYSCFAPGFIENLSEMARAKREGRVPAFK